MYCSPHWCDPGANSVPADAKGPGYIVRYTTEENLRATSTEASPDTGSTVNTCTASLPPFSDEISVSGIKTFTA